MSTQLSSQELMDRYEEIKKLRSEGKIPKMPKLEHIQAQLNSGEHTQEEFEAIDDKWLLSDEAVARNTKEIRAKKRLII